MFLRVSKIVNEHGNLFEAIAKMYQNKAFDKAHNGQFLSDQTKIWENRKNLENITLELVGVKDLENIGQMDSINNNNGAEYFKTVAHQIEDMIIT